MNRIVFWGIVQKGDKRGRLLGYPTVNLRLHKNIPDGIYIAIVKVNEKIYQSATFIGTAEMFGKKEKKAESYILNFNKDIYNKWITVTLLKKIRDSKKFGSIEALKKQIKQDVSKTQHYFKTHPY